MAITYHAGRRIQGTQADFDGIPAVTGGWKEVGRTTLGSAGDDITVSSLDDKRYYMVLTDLQASGYILNNTRLNSDTGSNYAWRRSLNGASDSTSASQTFISQSDTGAQEADFSVEYITNLSSKEKLTIAHVNENPSTGAGTAPTRIETVGKWANTSDAVSTITKHNSHTGDYTTGSECVVLGYDPDDTHTTNFWEELASVDVTTGTSISTGNFTAKKYLWVQFYLDASAISFDWQFNSSTDTQTSTYSGRHQNNGIGASGQNSDYTQINKNVMAENFGLNASPHFGNMFIVNNASKEKLVTGKLVNQNTATAGNAPNRAEFAYKWANTTNQINNITMLNSVNVSRFKMKVWGSN